MCIFKTTAFCQNSPFEISSYKITPLYCASNRWIISKCRIFKEEKIKKKKQEKRREQKKSSCTDLLDASIMNTINLIFVYSCFILNEANILPLLFAGVDSITETETTWFNSCRLETWKHHASRSSKAAIPVRIFILLFFKINGNKALFVYLQEWCSTGIPDIFQYRKFRYWFCSIPVFFGIYWRKFNNHSKNSEFERNCKNFQERAFYFQGWRIS
jgi:hypothetical protein